MTQLERSRLIDEAVTVHRTGDQATAAALYEEVLRQLPSDYDALYLLGVVEYQREANSRAIELLTRAVASDPLQAAAHNALGLALRLAGRATDAICHFRDAARLDPGSPSAHYNLGLTLFAHGEIGPAIESFRSAIRWAPEHKNALYNLALALTRFNRWEEACEFFLRVLSIDPGFSAAHLELASALRQQGKLTEALEALKQGVASCPGNAYLLCRAGGALVDLRQWNSAAGCFRKALELDPGNTEAQLGLGVVEVDTSQEARALPRFESLLRHRPDSAEAYFHRARALCGLGNIEGAIDGFRRAQELGLAAAGNNIASIIPGDPRTGNREVFEFRRNWARAMPREPDRAAKFKSRRRGAEEKLRIGYVSRSFQHRNWMKPVCALLNRHDRRRFAVCLFSDAPRSAVGDGYVPHPGDEFQDTRALASGDLARLIERCEIDILVDLNSYGALARLAVFALKPAPLIIGWFNSFATTGMEEFDFLIGDSEVIPEEEEQFYSERIVRVPGSYLTFEVNYPVPDVAPPPCLGRGYFTFGSMCSLYKLTDGVIAAWASILKRCPPARLFLKNAGLASAANREWLTRKFEGLGIESSRLLLEGPSGHYEFLSRYAEIDIALDAFPYNGGTTTTEAIWQGVPVITFRGDRWASRTSASLLVNGGLGKFVARECDEYVEMAVAAARDRATPGRLEQLRREMRGRLSESPVCDVAGFTRNVERIYVELWEGRVSD